MKKIIWILIILVVLVISGGVSYYFIFRNDSEENLITELETNHLPDSLADSLQNSTIILDTVIIVDEPEIKDSINIQAIIDSLNNQLMIQENLINEYKNKNEELLNRLELAKRQVVSIKDLAKTYESMKPEEMKPILSNLDDGTVIAIYNSMSSRNKKTIFKALNPKRAAEITELLAGGKKED
jgi:flagellar motility protein MotE (MotC chaperone)|tara:strand:+ start:929 stop:1477 length:549 start_codon:yes stop_codon:yes gene_type:complete